MANVLHLSKVYDSAQHQTMHVRIGENNVQQITINNFLNLKR